MCNKKFSKLFSVTIDSMGIYSKSTTAYRKIEIRKSVELVGISILHKFQTCYAAQIYMIDSDNVNCFE